MKTAGSWFNSAMALLAYEWIYCPLMKGWGIEAWSITYYALCIAVGAGIIAAYSLATERT